MMPKPAILVVDDHPENLLALERTLAPLEAELIRATSGAQALAESLESDLALALLDVRMPGMDGFELAELLRGDPKTRQLPIIFLTGAYSAEEQIFQGYESGAVDYLVKPFHPQILRSKVRVFLEMHAQQLELRRHRAELGALNRELEAFAYSVSHDLRAPLRAIEGFSQALLEDYGAALDAQGLDYLGRVSSEARRMAVLIDDLLTLSRVTRAQMDWGPVSLTDLARRVVSRLSEAAPDRVVDVVVADDLDATGDGRLLTQVLENLLSNAWKFTGRTDSAKIEVGRTEAQRAEAFYVRDNGVGFDMKYAGKLFTPFQRLHGMNEFPGTGVGLSTVQRIVARHGGKIWCESAVGQGTTFYFTLGEPREEAR